MARPKIWAIQIQSFSIFYFILGEKNYNFGITAHLIRNYFHQALNYNDKSMNQLMNLTLQDCPTIWRLFIRFEVNK